MNHHAHVPRAGMGLREQRVDERLATGELQPQHPSIGHRLQQLFPSGPVQPCELLFAQVAVLTVVVAAQVELVAGAGAGAAKLLGLAAAGVGDEEGAVVGCQDVLMNEREGGGGLEKNAEME